MTKEEIEMIKRAIDSHISFLYRSEDAYHRNGNIEAVKDCLSEIRKFSNLKDNIQKQYGNNSNS